MSIKVALVDDHTIVRSGVKALLSMMADIEVVAEAGNGQEAVERVTDSLAQVVIMDINMPVLNGLAAAERLLASRFTGNILFLSMSQERSSIVAALKVGGKGYVSKDCNAEELVKAVREVSAGNTYFSSKITKILVDDSVNYSEHGRNSLYILSRREVEVLRGIGDGMNTKEIASTMGISLKTVECHRLNIMKKLNFGSVAGLIRFAIREGISPLW